mmetsp:Transcript_33604/g.60262  ORF Transcript_33604/g.60262 Transcript_33604/m.60262 type:complete len:85 (-) Transcript_33604:488-742(-)
MNARLPQASYPNIESEELQMPPTSTSFMDVPFSAMLKRWRSVVLSVVPMLAIFMVNFPVNQPFGHYTAAVQAQDLPCKVAEPHI